MGSFSIWHWLLVLIIFGVPIAIALIVMKVSKRKKVEVPPPTGIIYCRNCGGKIHSTAPQCPHCGKAQ